MNAYAAEVIDNQFEAHKGTKRVVIMLAETLDDLAYMQNEYARENRYMEMPGFVNYATGTFFSDN